MAPDVINQDVEHHFVNDTQRLVKLIHDVEYHYSNTVTAVTELAQDAELPYFLVPQLRLSVGPKMMMRTYWSLQAEATPGHPIPPFSALTSFRTFMVTGSESDVCPRIV